MVIVRACLLICLECCAGSWLFTFSVVNLFTHPRFSEVLLASTSCSSVLVIHPSDISSSIIAVVKTVPPWLLISPVIPFFSTNIIDSGSVWTIIIIITLVVPIGINFWIISKIIVILVGPVIIIIIVNSITRIVILIVPVVTIIIDWITIEVYLLVIIWGNILVLITIVAIKIWVQNFKATGINRIEQPVKRLGDKWIQLNVCSKTRYLYVRHNSKAREIVSSENMHFFCGGI